MKFIIREESDRFRILRMKRGTRSMITIDNRLYRTDDELFSRDPKTSDAFIQYPVSSTQPVLYKEEYVSTEETRLWILSGKLVGNVKKKIANLNPDKIMGYLPVFIVGAVLVWFALKQFGLIA